MTLPPQQPSIQAILADRVREQPNAIAIQHAGDRLDFAQLDRLSDRLADCLRREGVVRGTRVGLWMERPLERILALVAILKAGGAYVPFENGLPALLLSFMADDSGIALMLTDARAGGSEPGFWSGPSLAVDSRGLETAVPDPVPFPETGPEDLAYVLYTSGTSGRPKGVAVPHRGVVRLVRDADYFEVRPGETFLQLAPLSFDASTFEIWAALLNGCRLVLMPAGRPSVDGIADTVLGAGVTTLWLTAGLFNLMVDARPDGLAGLRQLLVGGDVVSEAHVGRALARLPGCTLINGYGPTENTTFSCCHTIPRGAVAGPIPIGRPINGTAAWILDEALEPVADGEEGELCVSGLGLADGYVNQPDLTAERFVRRELGAAGAVRIYRTGDIARRRPDGVIEFLGRRDGQIKIDGRRIESAGIEAIARCDPQVRDAVVDIAGAGPGGRRIVLHLVAPDGAAAVAGLRARLQAELPAYMMPSEFVVHPALPLTPNGKLDRAALRGHGEPSATPAAPGSRSGVALAVMGAWQETLGLASVPTDRNFFDLGGTSLQLMSVHVALQRALGYSVRLMALFEHPTVSALVDHLERGRGGNAAVAGAQDRGARQRQALLQRRAGQSGAGR